MDNYIGQWFVEKTDNVTLEQAINDIVDVIERPEEYDFSVKDLIKYVVDKWNIPEVALSFDLFGNAVRRKMNEMQKM
jgi:hypothetical protein